jgi:hypothetical protein
MLRASDELGRELSLDIDELPCMGAEDELLFRPSGSAEWATPPAREPSPPPSSVRPSEAGEAAKRHVGEAVDALDKKRAERLQRNRQSAHNLRERKRLYTERVEAELAVSKAQATQLAARVSALTAENGVLRTENSFLRGVFRDRTATPTAPADAATPPLRSTHKRARGAGATMALSLVAVLGLVGYHGEPTAAPGGRAAGGSMRRAMAETLDGPGLSLALPDTAGGDGAQAGRDHAAVPSLPQALLPYVRLHDEGTEVTLDWAALCQLGALQLGSDRYIILPPSQLRELGWAATPLGASPGTGPSHPLSPSGEHGWRHWLPVLDVGGSSRTARESATILLEEEGEDVSLGGGVIDETIVRPKVMVMDNASSSPSSSSDHIHRVLHMLSSMSQDDKKVMLDLLTSDAEHDRSKPDEGNSSDSGVPHSHSQWTTATPTAVSTLSILLPGKGGGEGEDGGHASGDRAAEVIELSCGLARTWKVGPLEAGRQAGRH